MDFDKNKIQELLDESSAKVEAIMKDTAALENILQSAEQKLKDIPGVGQYAAKLPLMLSMIRSYIAKEYTEVSPKVVVSMVGALVYMLKGKDLIPDKIPVIGAVDDLAVLGLALQLNTAELEAYKIGEALKKARKEQNLTQKKLGEMVGVKEAQISKIENGKSVAFTTIIRLFKALGAKTASLDLGNMGRVALW